MSTQTVYFNDPADIVALQNATTSMSGTLNSLKWNTVTLQNWTAASNTNYIWNLADTRNASIGSAIVTFPSAPNDGDFIEIVDGLGTWGNCLYTNIGLNMNGKSLVGMTEDGTVNSRVQVQGGFRDYRKGSVLFTYRSADNTWYANGTVGSSMSSEYPEVANNVENPWDGWWLLYTPFTTTNIIFGKANNNSSSQFAINPSNARAQNYSHVYFDTSVYPFSTLWLTGNLSEPDAGGAYSVRAFEYYTTGGVIDKSQIVNAYSQVGSLAFPPWSANNTNVNSQGGGFRLQNFSTGPTPSIATMVANQLVPDFQVAANTNWGVMIKLRSAPGYSQKAQLEASISQFSFAYDVADGKNFNDQTENFKSMCLKAIYQSNPQSQQIGGLTTSSGRFVYEKDPYFIGNTGPNGFNAGGIQAIEVMNQFLSPNGITFTTPITQIIKSYSGAATVNGFPNAISTGSTEVTTIFTRGASYCTPGSTVTISGLTGSWSVMNGTYPNGVSLWENITRKSFDPASLDGVLTDTEYTGSLTNTYNRFNLIFNSWSGAYEAQTTGAYLNYAENFGLETAQVSVTHRVRPTMGYNELFSAFMAFLNYVFGPITHTRSTLQYLDTYRPDVIGRMATNWHLIGTSSYTSRSAQDTCNTRPQEINCVPVLNYLRRGSNKYSWYMRNDPYSVNNSLYYAYYATGSSSSLIQSSFVSNNYLMTGTARTLWYGVDGPLYKNVIYNTGYFQSAGTSLGLLNLTFTGTIGGSTFVGRMFDVNATPVASGGPTANAPDTRYWAKFPLDGRTGSLSGYSNNKYAWVCGLINPDYTVFNGYSGWTGATGTSRRIGYINYPATEMNNRWVGTSAFAPPVNSTNPTGPYNPQLATDPGAPYNAAFRNILSAMFTYLLAPTGAGGLACDSLILDTRSNQGGAGGEGEEISTFFGDNRNGLKNFTRKADDGFSSLIDPDTLKFPLDTQTILNTRLQTIKTSENKINYPYAVFAGSGTSYLDAKKLVYLNSDGAKSNGSKAVRYFSGDNKDGKIGSNTIVKFVGSVDAKFQGSSTTNYADERGDFDNTYMNIFPSMQWNVETPSYNLSCQYVPTGSTGTLWYHVDYSTFAPTGTKNGYRGTSGIGSALPQDLQNYLYPGMGAYPSAFADHQAQFPNLYLPGKTEVPDITNPLTWRDPWVETAIYEAMVPVLPGEN